MCVFKCVFGDDSDKVAGRAGFVGGMSDIGRLDREFVEARCAPAGY
jgi:hypothetical protein